MVVDLKGVTIQVERIGCDGDVAKWMRLFGELDGQVDAFGVGGVDMALLFEGREYPLHAVQRRLRHVRHTPLVDGRGLKYTLERRVWELAAPALGGVPHFRHAFMPLAVDRGGMALAVGEVADEVVYGDLMVGLGLPIPLRGVAAYKRVVGFLMPFVSWFPLSIIFYGSSGEPPTPKYHRYWQEADLLAGDFTFMLKYLPEDLAGKTILTNTTTEDNVRLLTERGVHRLITTTPRYGGRSFGTNVMEAMLTAYAGQGRPLRPDELNALIDELDLRPSVAVLNP
ncbi:MAG: quinate 5-dehydrogenase [Chloroflexota bacterium]